jgi:hypothetical protein
MKGVVIDLLRKKSREKLLAGCVFVMFFQWVTMSPELHHIK